MYELIRMLRFHIWRKTKVVLVKVVSRIFDYFHIRIYVYMYIYIYICVMKLMVCVYE